MLADLLTLPCTIVTRQPGDDTDRYGNPIDVETTTSTLCELQQASRAEDTATGTIATTEWRLFLPPGATLTVDSAVTVAGVRYDVTGQPWRARNPRTGEIEHIEATLALTSGATP